ncbi:synaptotagmin-2-like [Gavia stellata]|uniref:synaptotagmin-2-like n=1 Tax=Gavia stellata TaxID=37040 RepID=UPI00289AF7E1|nr:synaptotagmin-2-like [Gavia stellata]
MCQGADLPGEGSAPGAGVPQKPSRVPWLYRKGTRSKHTFFSSYRRRNRREVPHHQTVKDPSLFASCPHFPQVEVLRTELGERCACLLSSSSRTEDISSTSSDSGLLPRSRGTLKFSLLYCRERCELLLTDLEARGLPGRGCAESAIRVRLLRQVPSHIPGLQCVVQEWRSQVVKNCSRPAFGDHFVCSLQDAEVEKSTLKLEVQRFDKYSRNSALGEVRVTLSELKASQSLVFCEELQKTTKDVVGEVLVSLKCLPISQRIEVGLLKAKTTSPRSTADVYARIDVSCRHHRKKHQKSRPRAHTPLIIFNETFLFHMPEPPAWDCTVLVSIYEVDSDPRHLVGQATLGKRRANAAAEHWDLMIKSIQQPVAQWHPLLI